MKRLLCYGDSNTWGYNPVTRGRYPESVRWTGILQELLNHRGVTVIEEGLCGRTTSRDDALRENLNGVKLLPMVLETAAPVDAAVIMLGTNDCKTCYGSDAGAITNGLEQCVNLLLSVLPPEKLLIAAPILIADSVHNFDPEFDAESALLSARLADSYRELALRKGARFISAADYAGPCRADGEHMDEKGHAAFAKAVYAALCDFDII